MTLLNTVFVERAPISTPQLRHEIAREKGKL